MKKLILVALMAVSLCYGQSSGGNRSSGAGITITTVAGLASVAGKVNGTIATVTNGNTATDCTAGGGATLVNCQFNGATWSQVVASSSGGTAFSALTGSTNSTAAMVIGTGASMGVSGSGTNTATALTGTPSITVNSMTATTIAGNPAFSGTPTGLTSAMVGLGSVTNNAQTQAAIVPNTAPSSGQILAGNAGNTAYAPVTVSGDSSITSAGVMTNTKINNVSFAGLGTGLLKNTTGTGVPSIALSTDFVASAFGRTGAVVAAQNDYTFDLLANPAVDKTLTWPIAATVGLTLAGTAPASVSTATGTNALPVLTVSAVAGGADSNATGTGGIGSSPVVNGGAGGQGTGTNAVGGAGGTLNFAAGAGGASNGTGVNSNGGNIILTPGAAGTGGSGTAGKAGVVQIAGPNAGFFGYQQGAANTSSNVQIPATTIIDQAPVAVTSGIRTIPGVLAQGQLNNIGGSAALTQGYSGDANYSATVTIGSGSSIGSTSLCSTTFCPVGTYRVNVYVDLTTPCGTTGTYVVNLIYTDDQGSKTVPVNLEGTGSVPATGVLTTTSTANFGYDAFVLRSTGGASINYSTTAVACGTAGPMVGKLYLSVESLQP